MNLRILAVIPTSDSPSAMIFAKRQVEALRAQGYSVEVFELRMRRSPIALTNSFLRLRADLRRFQPHIVHAHYGAATAFLSVCASLGLARAVITFRGSDLNPVPSVPSWQMWPSHLLSQIAAFGAAAIICVSEELRRRLWIGKDRATVIPTGVDTTKFRPGSRSAARRSLGWKDDIPVVLFNAGRSPEVKRLDRASRVVGLAKEVLPNLKFVILDGSAEPDVVPTMMQASDCLLLMSDFEGSPTVIQEAMACNLPIISVPVGDVPERLEQVTHSHVFPWHETRMADALVAILRERPRSNGYEIVEKEVGIGPIVRLLERAYGIAVDQPR